MCKGGVSCAWVQVAVEMEDYKWFGLVGRRSVELQEMVRSA